MHTLNNLCQQTGHSSLIFPSHGLSREVSEGGIISEVAEAWCQEWWSPHLASVQGRTVNTLITLNLKWGSMKPHMLLVQLTSIKIHKHTS